MSQPFSASPATEAADPTAANDNHNEVQTVFAVMTAMTDYFVSVWSKTDDLRALKHDKLMIHYGWTSKTHRPLQARVR